MKSSQAIPAPGQVTGGIQAPGPQTQDQVMAPQKTPYSGVDVSPVIAPPAPAQESSSAARPDALTFLADHITPKNPSGQAVADVLRRLGPSYQSNPPTSPMRSPIQSLGGWQSLMQRMQPR
jgi:hypothetical protein